MEISYSKNGEGAWVLSTTVGNAMYVRAYYFYNKKEATDLFKSYVKERN
jgi:hypothetical protein